MSDDFHVENGRKGGEARAKKFWPKIKHSIILFIRFPELNQDEIAKRVGASQAFVSKHTSYNALKIARLSAQSDSMSEDELEALLEKIKLEVELKNEIVKPKRSKL
ncbi:hypothetical protein [Paraburkholderia xenovorans]|jgi:predicted transcriptional regulator|uniref:Uncharacterized protein n=1 Tax=Paraburkholderia xenovorans (strain LB400) TaxID=266265 RepID=Q145D1_PARXL|nr:hypothetical protein [Paraburkholderia xenovorans]ABE29058.1 hypothetical protein Bxe_A3941 [Paraburkholderia xenovorans LB400]